VAVDSYDESQYYREGQGATFKGSDIPVILFQRWKVYNFLQGLKAAGEYIGKTILWFILVGAAFVGLIAIIALLCHGWWLGAIFCFLGVAVIVGLNIFLYCETAILSFD
jgi:hypothetical protein